MPTPFERPHALFLPGRNNARMRWHHSEAPISQHCRSVIWSVADSEPGVQFNGSREVMEVRRSSLGSRMQSLQRSPFRRGLNLNLVLHSVIPWIDSRLDSEETSKIKPALRANRQGRQFNPHDRGLAAYVAVTQAFKAASSSSCGLGALFVPNSSAGSSASIAKSRTRQLSPS